MHLNAVLIKSGIEDYYLHYWSDVPPYAFVERPVFADSILTGCLGNFTRMHQLRSFLCRNDVMQYSMNRMSDHQVLDAIRHMIKSGRAVVVMKRKFLGNQFLKFNGKQLVWGDYTGNIKKWWPAVSGRPGYQGKGQQSLQGQGPLPEGTWMVKQSEYQRISAEDAIVGLTSIVGLKRGKWPGSVIAWGAHRVWLHPKDGTNTYGRKDFSIHGGWKAGSAGCIDLTSYIGEFVSMFLEYGKDMELVVEYR